MKKIFRTILISLLIFTTGAGCFAQELTLAQFQKIVSKQIQEDLKNYELDELEVTVNRLPVQKLVLPDGKVSVKVTSNSKNLVPREYKKIDVYVNNKYQQTFYVQAEIKAYKYAVVAKELIPRDKIIPMQSVELKKENVITCMDTTLNMYDISKGLVAGKVFYPGEILSKRFAKAKPEVVKNSTVTVNFQTNSDLTVSVEGIAMTTGYKGDLVQVKNKRYNKIYSGKVVGENQVLIQI